MKTKLLMLLITALAIVSCTCDKPHTISYKSELIKIFNDSIGEIKVPGSSLSVLKKYELSDNGIFVTQRVNFTRGAQNVISFIPYSQIIRVKKYGNDEIYIYTKEN